MASRNVCPRGHTWTLKDGAPGVCPECGDAGTILPAPTLAPADEPRPVEPRGVRQEPGPEPSQVADWPAIPGYEILGVLGHGGMGVVYQARQLKLGRVVAVKMIQSGSAGEEARRRFRTEAEAVARLQHPNIVQIYEVGECHGLPYFSLEYIAGGNLARRLAANLPSPGQAATLVETLARAVRYAHECGILHRDLKPANILLGGDGRPSRDRASGHESGRGGNDTIAYWPEPLGAPKITDFGLAKQIDDESGQTHSGAVMGTPSYMAPEQAAGQTAAIGPCTDVYALGAILYEMLTGRPPFRAASVLETLDHVRNREPAPPRQLQPGLSRDLETICLKCLQKEPGRRYLSATALADDLHRFQAGEPITARPIGFVERGWRWCRRKPALAGLTGALLLLAVASFVVVTAFFFQADHERRRVATLNASLTLERGQTYCEEGDIVRGMLWIAHALELVPPEAGDLERTIRANLAAWSRQLHPLEAIFPQSTKVNAAAYSPDGRKIALAGFDGRVQMWDLATGEKFGPALVEEKEVFAVAFSPDGQIVATAAWSGVSWWDVATGRRLGPAVPQRDLVERVAFGPDGSRLLTYVGVGRCAENARLWDVASGQPVGSPLRQRSPVFCGVFSPDGRLVAVGGTGEIRLFHTATGQPAGRLEHPGHLVRAATFHPDGRTLVTSAIDPKKLSGAITHWNAATGERLAEPSTSAHPATGHWFTHAFSANGAMLLTGFAFDARLWNADTGKAIGPLMQHDGMITGAVFTPDGRRVLTASGDFTARVWDTASGLPLGSPLQHHEPIWQLAVSPDGQTALTGSMDRTAKLWRLSRPLARVLSHESEVISLAFSPDGETIWTGSGRELGRILSWDLRTRLSKPVAFSTVAGIRALALSRDGQVLVVGSKGQCQRWRLATGLKIEPDMGPSGSKHVFALAFSADDAKLAIGSQDGAVQVWNSTGNKQLYAPLEHGGEVRAVDFSPDGRLLMTASDDRTVRFWDAATGKPVGERREYNGAILAAVFSPDGKSYLTGGNDRIARVWDTATGAPVGPPLSHEGIVLSVAFSPDGRSIMTGSTKLARLWDAATGKTIGPPIAHGRYVRGVAFSPDGQTLASGGEDRTVQLVPVPQPVGGPVADVVRWVQVVTGHELDADRGMQVLSAVAWRERRDQLRMTND